MYNMRTDARSLKANEEIMHVAFFLHRIRWSCVTHGRLWSYDHRPSRLYNAGTEERPADMDGGRRASGHIYF